MVMCRKWKWRNEYDEIYVYVMRKTTHFKTLNKQMDGLKDTINNLYKQFKHTKIG